MAKPAFYCLMHVPFEGPGMIHAFLKEKGYQLHKMKLYKNQELPDVNEVDYLIVMGGPMNPEDEEEYPWLAGEKQLIKEMIEAEKPVLGICLGAQLISDVMGEPVYPAKNHEIGWYPVRLTGAGKQHPATQEWEETPTVFHWHSNTFDLPEGAVHLASTEFCANQAFVLSDNVIGLQFHLEMGPPQVQKMIENWGRYRESGPYVQSSKEMLQLSKTADETYNMLYHLLNYWISVSES